MPIFTSAHRIAMAGVAIVLLALTLARTNGRSGLRRRHPQRPGARRRGQSVRFCADVAIKGGRFVRIGIARRSAAARRSTRPAVRASPGWIDMMDQSGATLAPKRPRREQAARGRHDGDRRRRRHAGGGDARRRILRRRSSARASASTSAPTSARRRRASPSSATRARAPNAAELASHAGDHGDRRCRAVRWG